MRTIELNAVDEYFSRTMAELAEIEKHSSVARIAALLSHIVISGGVCLNLGTLANREYLFTYKNSGAPVRFGNPEEIIKQLMDSTIVGRPNQRRPILLDEPSNRLYLYRYWHYERELLQSIERLLTSTSPFVDTHEMEKELTGIPNHPGNMEIIKEVATIVLKNRLCVITGGPGSGKTTLVINLLKILIKLNKGIRIKLVAPTGKAATRLRESIQEGKRRARESVSSDILNLISEETQTIHRFLGNTRQSISLRHNELTPLAVDCLIVDEASMVDLSLMTKLVTSLPKNCRLILLGDKHQLASVEAGTVFSDLCSTGNLSLRTCVVNLSGSFRFDPKKGIGKLSALILSGKAEETLHLLTSEKDPSVRWRELPPSRELRRFLKHHLLPPLVDYLKFGSVDEAFSKFQRFMVLTALRRGVFGSININRLIESLLADSGAIPTNTIWYTGRPVLVTRNNYELNLFNGDVGICYRDSTDQKIKVFFKSEEGYRKISPARLSETETLFAMTIHKSQGSEFHEVVLILPDQINEVLSKELFYTGITRAREEVEIWGTEPILRQTLHQRVQRTSGLKDGLDELSVSPSPVDQIKANG